MSFVSTLDGTIGLWPVIFAGALLGIVAVASLIAAGARDDGVGPLPDRHGFAYVVVPVSLSVDGGPKKRKYHASIWEDGFLIDVSDRVDRLMMPTWFFGVGSPVRIRRRTALAQGDSLTVEYLRRGQHHQLELGVGDLAPLLAGLDGIGFDTEGTVEPGEITSRKLMTDASPPIFCEVLSVKSWFGVLSVGSAAIITLLALTGTVYGYLLAGYLAISWVLLAMKWKPWRRRLGGGPAGG